MARETSRCMANWRGVTKFVKTYFHGSRLCQMRIDAGYKTAVSFAIACGLGVSTYNCLETGDRLPNLKQKEAIARTLDMTVEEAFPVKIIKEPKVTVTFKPIDELEEYLNLQYGDKLITKRRA